MVKTPEGKVKKKVKELLDIYRKKGYPIYSNWPVPYGYGVPMLDCVGCAFGYFFMVETKAPGGKMTARQKLTAQEVGEASGAVFVVEDDESLDRFESWLKELASDSGMRTD